MKKSALGLVLLLSACRPDPGPADYTGQDLPDGQNPDGGGPVSEMLPGPFPFEAGQRRLMVGVFYETGRSEEVLLDNSTTNFYLYDNTVYVESDPDRVEGKTSDRILWNSKAWLGFGVHWSTPRNLDAWKTLHISMKGTDAGFAKAKIGMSHGTGGNEKGFPVDASKYGWKNDGEWHHLSIPVSDFTALGLRLNDVSAPFVFTTEGGSSGQSILLDNLYFTAN
jgi:hypothetical protein